MELTLGYNITDKLPTLKKCHEGYTQMLKVQEHKEIFFG